MSLLSPAFCGILNLPPICFSQFLVSPLTFTFSFFPPMFSGILGFPFSFLCFLVFLIVFMPLFSRLWRCEVCQESLSELYLWKSGNGTKAGSVQETHSGPSQQSSVCLWKCNNLNPFFSFIGIIRSLSTHSLLPFLLISSVWPWRCFPLCWLPL